MNTKINKMDKFSLKEEDALMIFQSIPWADGVYCPECKYFDIYNGGNQSNAHRYSCNACENNFSDFTNTPFEYHKIHLGKIIYILVHMGNKTVNQLAKEFKLHRNTVERYHKRIRESLLENHEDPSFDGEIEMDEVYIIVGEKGFKKTL